MKDRIRTGNIMESKMRLEVDEIFGENMVLQQEKPVAIWGKGVPKETIEISIQGHLVKTSVAEDGSWKAVIPELKASEQEVLLIQSKTKQIKYQNIAVGEVWLAGGQSNMEFFMRYDKDLTVSIEKCENSKIRFFDYPVVPSEKDRNTKDYSEFGLWRICNKENLQYYSAVAYYFAQNLQKKLGVPLGIVGCNCGGTHSCCWMDENRVKKYGEVWMKDYEDGVKQIDDLEKAEKAYRNNPMTDKAHPFANSIADKMMYGMSPEEMQQMFASVMQGEDGVNMNLIGPWHEWRPSGLYHTMLKHVAPYTIRGVIWYQGESDEDHPEIYADMMKGVIECWREEWGECLPFLMTQLAPFGDKVGTGGTYYPELREQQEIVTKRIKDVYCASIGDVGNEYDIHPKEKQPVGRRLALLARGYVYGEKILCDAPVVDTRKNEEDKIIINFLNAQGGLHLKGTEVNSLQILHNGQIVDSQEYHCKIVENQLQILFEKKKEDMETYKIEFAKTPYYEVNLYNEAEIPVKPFSA